MPADLNVDKICRVCMQNNDELKLIFEKLEGETTAADILTECTKYPVSRFDELPQKICKICIAEALIAFKFNRKCEESYCKLLALRRLHLKEDCGEIIVDRDTDKGSDPLETEEQRAMFPQFSCHICEREFKLREHLHRHLLLIHKILENTSESDSKSHLESQLNPAACDEDDELPLAVLQSSGKCSSTFTEKTTEKSRDQSTSPNNLLNKNLRKHIDPRHSSSERSQGSKSKRSEKCTVCDKSFTTKIYLKRHLEIHKKKRFVCRECAQSFPNKEDLTAHVKAEGHDKPLLCPECGLRCKTSHILMVHMRRHSGEKPFKCKFCNKGFPRMDDLRIHEKYHTGEKSHYCETCGKGFQRKYNLTIHLRVHTREKPYKCQRCPQAFAQGNDLKAHIRRHTGERFRCDLCDAAFLQIYQIRQHKLCEHGIREDAPTKRVAKFTSTEAQEMQIKQNLQNELKQSIDAKTLEANNGNIELEALPIDINEVGSSASEVVHALETSDLSNIQF